MRLNVPAIVTAASAAALLYSAAQPAEHARAHGELDANASVGNGTSSAPVGLRASGSAGSAAANPAGIRISNSSGTSSSVASASGASGVVPRILDANTPADPLRVYTLADLTQGTSGTFGSAKLTGTFWQAAPAEPPTGGPGIEQRQVHPQLPIRVGVGQHDAAKQKQNSRRAQHSELEKDGKGNTGQNLKNVKHPPQPVHIQLQPLDLADLQHNRRLPASSFLPTLQSVVVPPTGEITHWAASVPMQKALSGRYQGYLLARRWTTNPNAPLAPFAIPAKVEVRDQYSGPLAILLLGVLISLGLQWYAVARLDQDRLLVHYAEAERLVLSDPALADGERLGAPFRRRIAEKLRAGLASASWAGTSARAATTLAEAETCWMTWQQYRPDWIAGLASDRRELAALAGDSALDGAPPGNDPHLAGLVDMLRQGYWGAPDLTAAQYRKASAERAARGLRYRSIMRALDSVRERISGVSDPATRQRLLSELTALWHEWGQLDPSDDAAVKAKYGELLQHLDALRVEAGDAGSPIPKPAAASPERLQAEDDDAEQTDSRELIPRRFRPRIQSAEAARETYVLALAGIVYFGLVLYGFQQTYVQNPIFGAEPLADYLAVAAWALGADLAARATMLTFSDRLLSAVRSDAQSPGTDSATTSSTSSGSSGSAGARPESATGNAGPLTRRLPSLLRL